jgi:SAM-dependent methyltransferase
VIAVSTIEHIGLGHYGDAFGERGDERVVKEITRILKPDGKLLATVPYGKHAITPSERIYDASALKRLFQELKIEKTEYFLKKNGYLGLTSKSKLANVDSSKGMGGLACVRACKPR